MDNGTKTVIELLAKGISQSDIARMLDVTASAISQIATKYSEEIADVGADSKLAKVSLDSRIDKMEGALMGRMEGLVEHETDLRVLAGIFKIMNGAVRRSAGESLNGATTSKVANLTLHQNFIAKNIQFVKNANGEIVRVGDTNLTTATNDSVKLLAAEPEPERTLAQEMKDELFG